MHPVFSDIAVADIEARTRFLVESKQRIDLARQGQPSRHLPMWKRITLLAKVAHRVLDPRGHALQELAASQPTRATPNMASVRNGSGKGADVSRIDGISRHTAGSPPRPITAIPPEGKVA